MAKQKKFVQNNNNLAIAYYRYSSHAQNEASIDQQREAAEKYAEAHGYLEGLESELKAVDKALDNLIKALEKGFFGDRLQERMTELENRKKALTDTIAAERIRREAIEDEHTIYAYFQKFLNANLDDPEVRDTVLEGLVDKIFLYDGYFEITCFYSDDRTVIEWDEVEDGQIEYSGFIEPADEFDDFADAPPKENGHRKVVVFCNAPSSRIPHRLSIGFDVSSPLRSPLRYQDPGKTCGGTTRRAPGSHGRPHG